MPNIKYREKIFQVVGENIKPNPKTIFNPEEVYLFIDENLNVIWIWAGEKSKLFHRYIASSWAGKLKSKKQYFNYNYELVKQGREPKKFKVIIDEVEEGRSDLNYPGESRTLEISVKSKSKNDLHSNRYSQKIPNKKVAKITAILSEVQEMQSHIRYSLEHIGKRIRKIDEILNS
ncbi:MAG: hypothetical protein EU541_00195 [Promethearchaeota archaeon]|nr:MAG: hypothetical protein EU541_00195 [Candidatus Lokiarchaeota archaeon]